MFSRRLFVLLIAGLSGPLLLIAQPFTAQHSTRSSLPILRDNNEAQHDSVYIFCYFKGSSKDGLHLAYSKDGYTWQALKNDSSFLQPAVAKDLLMRDPNIIRGRDGLFHMVWTVSWNDRGIGYANSPDLVHWSKQRYLPMDSVIESGYDHRMHYSYTKDFTKFSKPKILYDKGFNVIDASIVVTGDKYLKYIMFIKDETRLPVPEKNIKVASSKKLHKKYSMPSAPITGAYWAEGPTVLKMADRWIVYFDKYRDHVYGAVESTDLKNWKEVSEKIVLPKGIRHGSIFVITGEELEKLKKGR